MRPPNSDSQRAIVEYIRAAHNLGSQSDALRSSMERLDREYAREADFGRENRAARARNEYGNKRVIQDITVPVIFPQTESAHAYLSGVFLSGFPIFATVASPENMIAADMMDAVNAQHQVKGDWIRALGGSIRDGLKHNIMAVEVDWCSKKTYGLQRNNVNKLEARPTVWAGNVMRKMDLYNTFWDNRVPIAEVHKRGEFAGYTEIISRIALKQLLVDIDDEWKLANDTAALESPLHDMKYYVPDIVQDKFKIDPKRMEFSWEAWANNVGMQRQRIQYKDYYEKSVIYARILPEDFGLQVPARSTPQIWKFTVINSSVVIHARRMVNAHDFLPIIFGCPYEDGLDYQAKSFSENLVDVQNMTSALWNIRLAAARRTVGDRMLYDPRYIRPEDINSSNPSARIPIRPNVYLDDLRKAVYPFPYSDSNVGSVIQDASQIMEFGRSISGISRPAEGQFLKGNRTLGEYNDIRDNGDARLQMSALFLEAGFFAAIKEVIKYNVMQFLEPQSVYFSVKKQKVEINPQVIQDAALDFKISDGLLSSSKIADSDFLAQFMQLIPQSQELQARFDVVKLITYLAQLRNIPGLDAFERDMATAPMQNISGTPQAMNAEAQAAAAAVPPTV